VRVAPPDHHSCDIEKPDIIGENSIGAVVRADRASVSGRPSNRQHQFQGLVARTSALSVASGESGRASHLRLRGALSPRARDAVRQRQYRLAGELDIRGKALLTCKTDEATFGFCHGRSQNLCVAILATKKRRGCEASFGRELFFGLAG
jgi:hypothetical protein